MAMMERDQDDAGWMCICGHLVNEHGQGKNDAVDCDECECPDFITAKEADNLTDTIYEWALEDGETWATTAHNYRRHRLHIGSPTDQPDDASHRQT